MSDYKQQVIDFFERRTAYDAEGDSHPNEAKRLSFCERRPSLLATG